MKKYLLVGGLIIVVVLVVSFFWLQFPKQSVLGQGTFTNDITFFSATTTSATSTTAISPVNLTGVKKATFYFQRGDTTGVGNNGTSTFSVQISNTGNLTPESEWITYNKLIDNVTNSNSQNLTRVASAAFASSTNLNNATGTKAYSMDLTSDVIHYVRCIVVEVVDGEHTCKARVEY